MLFLKRAPCKLGKQVSSRRRYSRALKQTKAAPILRNGSSHLSDEARTLFYFGPINVVSLHVRRQTQLEMDALTVLLQSSCPLKTFSTQRQQ